MLLKQTPGGRQGPPPESQDWPFVAVRQLARGATVETEVTCGAVVDSNKELVDVDASVVVVLVVVLVVVEVVFVEVVVVVEYKHVAFLQTPS